MIKKKGVKKFAVFSLLFIFLITFVSAGFFGDFLGKITGQVVSGEYIEICTVQDLDNIRNNLGKKYNLVCDIDLANVNFKPIGINADGSFGGYFEGVFDGNFHTISNFKFNSYCRYCGFFGSSKGVIKNLILKNVDLSVTENAGGLVGLNYGEISNCSISGKIKGCSATGGLVGYNYKSSSVIKNSYSTASVSGMPSPSGRVCENRHGGLVGKNEGKIQDSYAGGSVTTVLNYRADVFPGFTEIVVSKYGTGGLVGMNSKYSSGAVVKNSYSTGFVKTTSTTWSFGLIGECGYECSSIPSGAVISSYWDTESSGTTRKLTNGGEGKTTAQMKTQSTFAGWDFNNIWYMPKGGGYPILRWQALTESCGNGQLEEGLGEECDDGNIINNDGCDSNCKKEQLFQHEISGNGFTLTYTGALPIYINIRPDEKIGEDEGYVWIKINSNKFVIDLGDIINPGKTFYYGIKGSEGNAQWSEAQSFVLTEEGDSPICDRDNDGYDNEFFWCFGRGKGGDCNDGNKLLHPDNDNLYCNCDDSDGYVILPEEICDGYDNDCNGQIDEMGTIRCDIGIDDWKYIKKCQNGKLQTCSEVQSWKSCTFATFLSRENVQSGAYEDFYNGGLQSKENCIILCKQKYYEGDTNLLAYCTWGLDDKYDVIWNSEE